LLSWLGGAGELRDTLMSIAGNLGELAAEGDAAAGDGGQVVAVTGATVVK
jgi:hypothetical protein